MGITNLSSLYSTRRHKQGILPEDDMGEQERRLTVTHTPCDRSFGAIPKKLQKKHMTSSQQDSRRKGEEENINHDIDYQRYRREELIREDMKRVANMDKKLKECQQAISRMKKMLHLRRHYNITKRYWTVWRRQN